MKARRLKAGYVFPFLVLMYLLISVGRAMIEGGISLFLGITSALIIIGTIIVFDLIMEPDENEERNFFYNPVTYKDIKDKSINIPKDRKRLTEQAYSKFMLN